MQVGSRKAKVGRQAAAGRARRNILVPIDASAPARRGLRAAIRLAHELKAAVTAVHVITPVEVYARGMKARRATRPALERIARVAAERLLTRAEQACEGARMRCTALIVWHDAVAEAIASTARTRSCDLIVMATHRGRGLSRVFTGSVARALVGRSPVPVVICP
jgi:nucleotide-binding universal stress UspA family protein